LCVFCTSYMEITFLFIESSSNLFCSTLLSLVPLTVFNCKPSLSFSRLSSSEFPPSVRKDLLRSFSPWRIFADYGEDLFPKLTVYPSITTLSFSKPHSPHFRSLLIFPELPNLIFSYSCPLCRTSGLYAAYPVGDSYRDSLSRILCLSCKNTLWPYL